ncbi:MAG: hypothetical protein JWR89_2887 [Tardiphaga sp.]|uniref:hypothetical protein n=1 Tax=Tardiphaga sp. TaxID=1926292 RepID=UPI00261F71AF|nr:hypothetical protein [Tardiphaga sp.]MDB5502985.1 hypothetical protein [Tardiphaga sp.]
MSPDDDFYLSDPKLTRGDRAFRTLYRHMANGDECWRTCDLKRCRRCRECRGNAMICVGRNNPAPELSEEELSRVKHEFKQLLTQQIAARTAAEAQAKPASAETPAKRDRDSSRRAR